MFVCSLVQQGCINLNLGMELPCRDLQLLIGGTRGVALLSHSDGEDADRFDLLFRIDVTHFDASHTHQLTWKDETIQGFSATNAKSNHTNLLCNE